MNKKDMFIKEKLQQDKEISDRANQIFENLKEEFVMDNNDKKVIKISFNKFLAIAASFVLVLFLGTNLYAHSVGKPNIFTAIKNLFNVDKEDYNAAEENINITVESNGVKLTLKTAAMDDNVLIVKYVAEGEKLAEEFYTYQDFEETQIDVNSIWAKLAGDNIEGYEGYTLKDVTIMQKDIVEKLKKQGLTHEEAKELADLGAEAYKEYIVSQLENSEYSEEKAKEKIEQVVAMFESKVSSKFSIITSKDELSGYNIETVAQSIEKEENRYVIHAIYNVDTLVEILETFNLNLQINKIGTIEGNWNYSVELNKAKLNKRVETIKFYNNYEVIIDSESAEQVEGSNLTVTLKQLSISDFSSVLNIKNVKEDYYNNVDYDNLENNIFPITFVVLNENDEVIGTSCQTREEAINANPIVDRIILKDVDYNTEKITIKMYSNNDNQLIKTLEVDLKEAKNLMDTSLENIFYNPEIGGILFKYPKDWVRTEIQDVTHLRLQSPENLDGKKASFDVGFYYNSVDLTSEEEFKKVLEYYSYAKIEEKGKILIGVNGITADYFIETHDGEKWKVIIVVVDETIYHISFGGDEKLYTKYETIFEEILKTMDFSEVALWEQFEELDIGYNSSNEIEENTSVDNTNVENTTTTVLYGDVNCDGVVDDSDVTNLLDFLFDSNFDLSAQGKINADVYKDGIINGKDSSVLRRYLSCKDGTSTLPVNDDRSSVWNNFVSSEKWISYWAPGIKFQYPSSLSLAEVGGDNRGFQPGCVSTEIFGWAYGYDFNTLEPLGTYVKISVYEPFYMNGFSPSVSMDGVACTITNLGTVWYVGAEELDNGKIEYQQHAYVEDANGSWAYVIKFTFDADENNDWIMKLMDYIIESASFTSY